MQCSIVPRPVESRYAAVYWQQGQHVGVDIGEGWGETPYGQERTKGNMETGGGGTEASEQAIYLHNLIWPFKGLECGINI